MSKKMTEFPSREIPEGPSETYEASCQCGTVTFSVTISPPLSEGKEVTVCNCSVCTRAGYLFVYLPNELIKIHSGEDMTTKYRVRRAEHCFCPTCGTNVYVYSAEPGGPFDGMKAVNVRAIKDIDVDKLTYQTLDGRSFPV